MPSKLSHAEETFGLLAGTYPFESHFADIDGARLHYIDEGRGPTLFMLHGNPSWSYVYRNIVRGLSDRFRCVAVDLAGFGLSSAPKGFDYTPAAQSKLVAGLLDKLEISDATLVAHDWGGPIGLSAMTQTQDRITRLCLGNTWAWKVNGDFHYEWFSKMMGGPFGRFGTNQFAMFINAVMPSAMKRRKLTKEEMTAYRAPFKNGKARTPMHVLPKHITASGDWLEDLEAELKTFSGPVQFIWPDKDIAFRAKELRRWQSLFPESTSVILKNCGHYLWEDAPEECIEHIVEFQSKNSRPVSASGA